MVQQLFGGNLRKPASGASVRLMSLRPVDSDASAFDPHRWQHMMLQGCRLTSMGLVVLVGLITGLRRAQNEACMRLLRPGKDMLVLIMEVSWKTWRAVTVFCGLPSALENLDCLSVSDGTQSLEPIVCSGAEVTQGWCASDDVWIVSSLGRETTRSISIRRVRVQWNLRWRRSQRSPD